MTSQKLYSLDLCNPGCFYSPYWASFLTRFWDIDVPVEFWLQTGSAWISFYILIEGSHHSQGVCDSPTRLRTSWCQTLCLIHCCIPQRHSAIINTMGPSCLMDHGTLGPVHLREPPRVHRALFPVSLSPLHRRIYLLGMRQVFVTIWKIIGLDCFKGGPKEVFFDSKFQTVHWWYIKGILGVLCSMFLFYILKPVYLFAHK